MTAERSRRPTIRARQALIRRSLPTCWLCGGHIDTHLPGNTPLGPSLHHRIPIALGGSDTDPTNHRLTHLRCNQIAGDRPPDEAKTHVRRTLGLDPTPTLAPAVRTRDWGLT